MKTLNGWVVLSDVARAAGYFRADVSVREEVKALGVEIRRIRDGAAAEAYCVPESEVSALTSLLKERREKNVSHEEQTKRIGYARIQKLEKAAKAPPPPPPKSPLTKPLSPPLPPKEPMGFKSTHQEFEATVRKLIHLCVAEKIDCITIQDGKAEIVRSVTVTREETIKG